MDFIERILGISPDGGSGLTELLWFAVPLLIALYLAHKARGKWSHRRG
jgi:hypothetical protein